MWILILRVAGLEPREFLVKPGDMTIGRGMGCDIVISDPSASREHAMITYDEKGDAATLHDLESTNGTYINQSKVEAPYRLLTDDRIRIGSSLIIAKRYESGKPIKESSGSATYTRDLLLQAVDYHAVLMYEVAQQLNSVVEIDEALRKVSTLMKIAMGADQCVVVLAKQFYELKQIEIPTSIARRVINSKTAIIVPDSPEKGVDTRSSDSAMLLNVHSALCVPVILNNSLVGIIYLDKRKEKTRKFDRDDLHLAIAISHQAALTIHRMNLMEQLREELKVRQVLQRFVSPRETEYLLKDVVSIGQLPGLSNESASVLFTDIVNSTGLAEKLGPVNFGQMLDTFYLMLTEIVFKYQGIIRYQGDGVIATFLSQGDLAKTAKIAIQAGLEILKYVAMSPDRFDVGVTINSGEVVAGYVGNAERVEFTVLGDIVNVAHGMQQSARPNRLVIGKGTVESLQIWKSKNIRQLEPIQVKNRSGLVEIFEIVW